MRCPTLFDLPPPPPGKAGWPWTVETPQLPNAMPDGGPWARISIVTPSYNQGDFIEETIRSVLLQGYPDVEYIIMDGGSDDGSREIIERYSPFLTYWVSQPDRGQSHAINAGFDRATGAYCNWLCSDDFLLPGALAHVAETVRPGYWLIGAAQVIVTQDRRRVEISHGNYRLGDVLYNSYILNQVSVFWPLIFFERVGGVREDLYYTMDAQLWMEFERIARPQVTRNPLGAFRTHPNQKTADAAGTWEEFWEVRRCMLRNRLVSKAFARAAWQIRRIGKLIGIAAVGPSFRDLTE